MAVESYSVVMPLRYLWVFVAFIAVVAWRRNISRNMSLFVISRWQCRRNLVFCLYRFCLFDGDLPEMEAFTAEWTFQLALNVATPLCW